MSAVIPWYWFDTTGDPDVVEKIRERQSDIGKGRKLRCRSCESVITDENQRISIEDNHTHSRSNPSGVEYQFQCFGNAPGCSAYGQATYEFTWFTGYRWQIALCSTCGEHLGWYFRGSPSFYGLISSRLLRDQDNS